MNASCLLGGVEASVWPARITRDLWASSEVRSWGGLYCAQGYWLQLTPVTRWINEEPGQRSTQEDEDETPASSNQLTHVTRWINEEPGQERTQEDEDETPAPTNQLTPVTRWINEEPGQRSTQEDEDETPAPTNQLTPVTRWINKEPGQKRTQEDDDETPAIKQSINQWYMKTNLLKRKPSKHKTCIAFVQCRTNVFDVGPTLYKCYANVLCLLGTLALNSSICITGVHCPHINTESRYIRKHQKTLKCISKDRNIGCKVMLLNTKAITTFEPSKFETFTQCWFIVGPPSTTSFQH